MIKQNSLSMKNMNKAIVERILKENNSITKREIYRLTEISVSTIGKILNEMFINNEIIKIRNKKITGGRPAEQYIYDYNLTNSLIIHLIFSEKKYYIKIVVINLCSEILFTNIIEIKEDHNLNIKILILGLLKKFKKIKTIIIGNSCINNNLFNLKNIDLIGDKQGFKKEIEVPILIENETNSAIIGLIKRMKLKKINNIVYFLFKNDYLEIGLFFDNKSYKQTDYELKNNLINLSEIFKLLDFLLNPDYFILFNFEDNSISNIGFEKNASKDISSKIIFSKNYYEDLLIGFSELLLNKNI